MSRVALVAALSLLGGLAHAQDPLPLVLTDDGHAVLELVQTQPFALAEGAVVYDFLKAHPALKQGQVVVVRVSPAFARPRDALMPVLYAGATPVQIVARDVAAGCLVGLLPASVDLAAEPLFFGSAEPPERVDAARGQAERAAALVAGLQARSSAEIASAQVPAVLTVRDATALYTQVRTRADQCE